MKITHASIFTESGFVPGELYVRDGRFVEAYDTTEVWDAQGKRIIPGLVDLHFHGCMAHDFCDADPDGLHAIAAYQAQAGITSMAPATMTYGEDKLSEIMDVAAAFRPKAHEASLVGINMEGPYISPDKIGAQNPRYIQSCDKDMFERLQKRAHGLIKIVDVAPEEDGAEDFISALSHEVRISLAHTCASYDQAARAFELGARHLTHMYNAMPGLHHRNPGPIPAALEHEQVTPELIADGVHIHPAMVRLAFSLFGKDRICLISDSMMATGLDDGEYSLGGQPVIVEGNKACLHDGTIAGSATNLYDCMLCAVHDMGIPLHDAVTAASSTPARALGLEGVCGTLAPGAQADCIVLDGDDRPHRILVRGSWLDE